MGSQSSKDHHPGQSFSFAKCLPVSPGKSRKLQTISGATGTFRRSKPPQRPKDLLSANSPARLGLGQLRNGNFAQVLSRKGIMVAQHTPPGAMGVWCTNRCNGCWLRSDRCKASSNQNNPGESKQSLNWPGSVGKNSIKDLGWWMMYLEETWNNFGFLFSGSG